jgi:hypothetical protein
MLALQIVAAILLILGSLLVLGVALRTEASPPWRGRVSGPRRMMRRRSTSQSEGENDWSRAA